jgi:hypothetical protein
VIDYLAELCVKFLILIACFAWVTLFFWGCVWVAEKIMRLVYQDIPYALFISKDAHEIEQGECRDCGGTYVLDQAGRCDLCVSIAHAVLEHWRDAREVGEDVPYASGSRAHDYDPLDFEDHADHDHEELIDGTGRVIKRICLP